MQGGPLSEPQTIAILAYSLGIGILCCDYIEPQGRNQTSEAPSDGMAKTARMGAERRILKLRTQAGKVVQCGPEGRLERVGGRWRG
jgi:hypothetical protein